VWVEFLYAELCFFLKGPPKANVPPRFQVTAMFEKNEEVVIKIPFTGNPKPTARWLRDNDEIKSDAKFKVEVGDRHAILTIRNADRADDGPYRLLLENDLGTDSAVIKIAVNGKSFTLVFFLFSFDLERSSVVQLNIFFL